MTSVKCTSATVTMINQLCAYKPSNHHCFQPDEFENELKCDEDEWDEIIIYVRIDRKKITGHSLIHLNKTNHRYSLKHNIINRSSKTLNCAPLITRTELF